MFENTPLRLIFAGTPEFAAIHLQSLLATPHEICAVYTQPDRPAGRGRKLTQSPVKQLALKHSLKIRQPETLNTAEEIDHITALQADIMIVVAYGVILKQTVLDAPRLGCINVHASLLPRWRGAAPIQRAIAAGDKETGISIMKMVRALDAGAVLTQATCPIHHHDTSASLHDRLANLGAQRLPQTLEDYRSREMSGTPQNEDAVTYASKLNKQEALLNWSDSSLCLDQKIRAFHPWPMAFTYYRSQPVRIIAAQILPDSPPNNVVPGTLVAVHKQGIDVATGGGGILRLKTLQMSGRKPLAATDFLNGLTMNAGDSFD